LPVVSCGDAGVSGQRFIARPGLRITASPQANNIRAGGFKTHCSTAKVRAFFVGHAFGAIATAQATRAQHFAHHRGFAFGTVALITATNPETLIFLKSVLAGEILEAASTKGDAHKFIAQHRPGELAVKHLALVFVQLNTLAC